MNEVNVKPNRFHGDTGGWKKPYTNGPKHVSKIAKWLKIFLLIFMPLAALELSFGMFFLVDPQAYIAFFQDMSEQQPMMFSAMVIFGGVYRLTYIICIVLTCMFLYRAARNLHTITPGQVKIEPTAAWLWFFVPIANLFKPYGAVVEIMAGSARGIGEPETHASMMLGWWITFITSVVIGNLTLRLGNMSSNALNVGMDVVSGILGIVAAIVFIKLISELTRRQARLINNGVAEVFA